MASATGVDSAIFVKSVSAATALNNGIAFFGTTACAAGCQRLAGLDGMALGARHRNIGGGGGGGGGKGGGIGGGGGGNDGGNRQLKGFEALLMLLSRNDGYHKLHPASLINCTLHLQEQRRQCTVTCIRRELQEQF